MHFTLNQIENLDHLYRINLINSISGFKSANLIGTVGANCVENVAVFSSVVHYGSNPPVLGFVLRPNVVPRNTYENIKDNGVYTINHIHRDIFEDAHHTSAKYPKNISEYSKTGLKPEYKDGFLAPYVLGCKIQLGMQYLEEYKIKVNNTVLVLGEVKHLYINEIFVGQDGFVDLAKANTAVVNGLDAYAFPTEVNRLEYQRPKK